MRTVSSQSLLSVLSHRFKLFICHVVMSAYISQLQSLMQIMIWHLRDARNLSNAKEKFFFDIHHWTLKGRSGTPKPFLLKRTMTWPYSCTEPSKCNGTTKNYFLLLWDKLLTAQTSEIGTEPWFEYFDCKFLY